MAPTRRRWLHVALYALALAGGATAAYATNPAAARTGAGPGALRRLPLTIVSGRSRPRPAITAAASEGGVEPAAAAPPPPTAPDPFGHAFRDGRIISGATPQRLILFTFDDGPDRRHTPLLLDRLDAVGVKAVFFLTASRIAGRNLAERQQAAIARDIVARGHIVANHTLDHAQLPLLEDDAARDQVRGAERVFRRVLGDVPALFRPPGGAHSPRIDGLLAELGYTTMLWNLGTGDFQVRSAEQVFDTWQKVFERRQRENGERGGIILMHDTYAWSVEAFQMVFGELQRRNCELLARGEELYDIVDDPTLFFEPRDDAAPSAFARPARPPQAVLRARQAALRERTRARCRAGGPSGR